MNEWKADTADIAGYGKPIFPTEINWLNVVYADTSVGWSGIFIRETAEAISCKDMELTESLCFPRTSDGYYWHHALFFGLNGSSVAILFPQRRDKKMPHGNPLDRSIAMYLKSPNGDIDMNAVSKLAKSLYDALTRKIGPENTE